eukprot:tig00020675_g12666.t1
MARGSKCVPALALVALFFVAATVVQADEKDAAAAAARRSQGDVAATSGDYQGAINHYSNAIDLDPKANAMDYYKRGTAYLTMGKNKPARGDLNMALSLDPTLAQALSLRAKIGTLQGDFEQAKADYEALLKLRPSADAQQKLQVVAHATQLLAQIRAAIQSGQHAFARERLEELLATAPDSSELRLMRADISAAMQDWQEVIRDAGRAIKTEPDNTRAYLVRGKAYYYMGEHSSAMNHYREAMKFDPDNKQVRDQYKKVKQLEKFFSEAEAALASGQTPKAVEGYTRALAVDPGHRVFNLKALVGLCKAHVKVPRRASLPPPHPHPAHPLSLARGGEWAKGVEACTRAIDADGGLVEAWIQRGEAKLKLEEWESVRPYPPFLNSSPPRLRP